jgi:hypothetical protein
MLRVPATILLCAGLAFPTAAKPLKASGDGFFCSNREDLMTYVVVSSDKDAKPREVPGCMPLRKGARYEVLDDNGRGVIRIRVRLSSGRRVEGYTIGAGE